MLAYETEQTHNYHQSPGQISLTWLWEYITRTKRLPDDLDTTSLFHALKTRLRNPEREIRLHSLRVLVDLIPVINFNLEEILELIVPELLFNLAHIAPSVRKATIDVLKNYLKHTDHPDEILRNLIQRIPKNDHNLMLGLTMALPYFVTPHLSYDTIRFIVDQLFLCLDQDALRETALASLIKIRDKIGGKFHEILDEERMERLKQLGDKHDNIILETEIMLDTGPAITMQIHEESISNEQHIVSSPRKVRFGGEVIKMRTPESDNSNQTSDQNDGIIIDKPKSVKITMGSTVNSIAIKPKSLIPVRIQRKSHPGSPVKIIRNRAIYKSAPELRRLSSSKIPLRKIDIKPKKFPTNKTYNSFQIYSDLPDREYFDEIIKNLNNKDDIKTKNLEPLNNFLKNKNLPPEIWKILLKTLERNDKLPIQQTLEILIANPIESIMGELTNILCRLPKPDAVRLSLKLLEKSEKPKKFLTNLNEETKYRETILQIIMAIARYHPETIDLRNAIRIAIDSMKDNRRKVRQAALETLASLAQIFGNGAILDIVPKISSNTEHLLKVIRTRLSRKQLPMIDVNGNIQYSTPKEQEEFEWLCGVSMNAECKNSLLNNNYDYDNYWRRNSRHAKSDYWNPNEPQSYHLLHQENETFRKSFSSDLLLSTSKENNYSSNSSVGSTGSSTKSASGIIWFRSSIPVPVQSGRRLQRRDGLNVCVTTQSADILHKIPSPSPQLPPLSSSTTSSPSPSSVLAATPPPLVPPTQFPPVNRGSSGNSESSGYFTPNENRITTPEDEPDKPHDDTSSGSYDLKSNDRFPRIEKSEPICEQQPSPIAKKFNPIRKSGRSRKDSLNLQQILEQIENYDWEMVMKGLDGLVKITRINPDSMEMQIHQICVALSRNIRNLRSQVARMACNAAGEIFINCKGFIDMEIDELAGPLLHRTADTNRFLRNDAFQALDQMVNHLPVHRTVHVISNRGMTHRNGIVRAASIRLLKDIVERLGPERVFGGVKEVRDRLVLAGANGLVEGNIDARKNAKCLLSILAIHPQFHKIVSEVVPGHTLRLISKTLNTFK